MKLNIIIQLKVLQSILVCTGVYNQEAYDEISGKNHGHRDMIIDPELKKTEIYC